MAGKTGTAEVNNNDLNDAWFIGFTDRFAVAVVIERVQGGTGGDARRADRQAKVLKSLGGRGRCSAIDARHDHRRALPGR